MASPRGPERRPPRLLMLLSAALALAVGLLVWSLWTTVASPPAGSSVEQPAVTEASRPPPVRLRPAGESPTADDDRSAPAPTGSPPRDPGVDEQRQRLAAAEQDEARRRRDRQAFARAAGLDANRTTSFETSIHRFTSALSELAGRLPAAGAAGASGTADEAANMEIATELENTFRQAGEEFQAIGITEDQLAAAVRLLPDQIPADVRQRLAPVLRSTGHW